MELCRQSRIAECGEDAVLVRQLIGHPSRLERAIDEV
jgi:hypothetical protein